MKKSGICIILLLCLFISGCASKHNADTVKDGTYKMVKEDIDEVFLPSINITGSQITFSYDLLSSYLSIGSYTIERTNTMRMILTHTPSTKVQY